MIVARRGRDQLLRARGMQQLDRRLVGVDDPALGVVHGHGLGERADDDAELLLGHGQLAREPRVVERERDPSREHLGEAQVGLGVAAAGRAVGRGDRADDAPARAQRDDQRGADARAPRAARHRAATAPRPRAARRRGAPAAPRRRPSTPRCCAPRRAARAAAPSRARTSGSIPGATRAPIRQPLAGEDDVDGRDVAEHRHEQVEHPLDELVGAVRAIRDVRDADEQPEALERDHGAGARDGDRDRDDPAGEDEHDRDRELHRVLDQRRRQHERERERRDEQRVPPAPCQRRRPAAGARAARRPGPPRPR